MALDQRLLDILACPEDKGPLYYVDAEAFLYNPRLRRRYAIADDIPNMLIDEAITVDAAEHDAIMGEIERRPVCDPRSTCEPRRSTRSASAMRTSAMRTPERRRSA